MSRQLKLEARLKLLAFALPLILKVKTDSIEDVIRLTFLQLSLGEYGLGPRVVGGNADTV